MKTVKNLPFFVFLAMLFLLGACEPQKPGTDASKGPTKPAEAVLPVSAAEPQAIQPPPADDFFAWGNRYYFGLDGTEQDYKKAFEFFNKAYQEQYDNDGFERCANVALGNMYYKGYGVKKDIKKAFKLWNEEDDCSTRNGNNIYSFEAFNNIREYIVEHKDKDLAFSLGDACFQRYSRDTIRCGHASSPDDDDRDACEQGEKWYKLAAEYGHPEAMVRLADNYLIYANWHHNCYSALRSDTDDDELRHEGEKLLLSAAEQGYVDAWEELGDMYFYGHLPMDHKKAEEWYLKAASKGKGHSAMMLARLYSGGKDSGVPADYQKAYYWANQAIARGVKEAKYYLGMLYYDGKGIAKDRNKAIKLFKEVPDDGEYEYLLAGIMLQNMYINGEGTAKDYEALAKEKGRCYYYYCTKGWIFGKDNYSKAEERDLWQAAFERNDLLAQIYLVQKYAKETDNADKQKSLLVLRALIALQPEPKDAVVKKEWQAAKEAVAQEEILNDTQAQRKMGAEYIIQTRNIDDLKTKDPYTTQAFEWYTLAARLGDSIAQVQLASMYGVDWIGIYRESFSPNSVPEEIYWLERASEQNNPIAQYELANKYYTGILFTDEQGAIYSQSLREVYLMRDLKKAFELYKKSAESGYVPAMKKLAYMYEHGEYVNPDYQENNYWKKKAEKSKEELGTDYSVNYYVTRKDRG